MCGHWHTVLLSLVLNCEDKKQCHCIDTGMDFMVIQL